MFSTHVHDIIPFMHIICQPNKSLYRSQRFINTDWIQCQAPCRRQVALCIKQRPKWIDCRKRVLPHIESNQCVEFLLHHVKSHLQHWVTWSNSMRFIGALLFTTHNTLSNISPSHLFSDLVTFFVCSWIGIEKTIYL